MMSGGILCTNHKIAARDKPKKITQMPKIISIFLMLYLFFSDSESML